MNVNALTGAATTLAILFDGVVRGAFVAMFVVLGFVPLRLAFRRIELAITAAVVLLALGQASQVLGSTGTWWIAAIFQVLIVAALTTVVVRYGLLVTAVVLLISNINAIPLTYSLSRWTATTSNIAIGTILGLALFGFYASRAGQPLLGTFD